MLSCQWCSTKFKTKKLLNEHEAVCEWKDKKLEWRKRVEENKDKIFWYIDTNDYTLKPCVLSDKHYQSVHFIQEDKTLTDWALYIGENHLFDNKINAQARLDYIKKLYFETFKHTPFLSVSIIEKHLQELLYIENKIAEALKDFKNFKGIDFCNVSAGGIQIRGHHKRIKNYTYGTQPTIKYDFSNIEECIQEFVEMWKQYDTPERVNAELRFIADGEKYGWD